MLGNAKGDDTMPQVRTPIPMHVDNEGARLMAENCINNRKSRHIEVRYHAIRDWCKKLWLRIVHLPGTENLADIFTKPLGRVLLSKFRDVLGVRRTAFV